MSGKNNPPAAGTFAPKISQKNLRPSSEGKMRRGGEQKKSAKPSELCRFWCRWPDSNRHAVASGGF